MRLGRRVADRFAVGVLVVASAVTGAIAQSGELPVTVVATDNRLTDARTMATDGESLYVGTGQSILAVPLTGASLVELYHQPKACCVRGLTRVGTDLFWLDSGGDGGAAALFRAPIFGGAVQRVPTQVDSLIAGAADITSGGDALYLTDQYGAIHALLADGSSMRLLNSRYAFESSSAIIGTGNRLYIADSGDRPDIAPANIFTTLREGGSPAAVYAGAPFIRLTDVEAANDAVFAADAGANAIWRVPASGGVPTRLAASVPFVQIQALAYWNNALFVADAGSADTPGSIYRIDLPNVAPTATGDFFTVNQDGTVSVPAPAVLGNDSDGAGESLTALLIDAPPADEGSVTLNQDGSFTFTPATGFSGDATFRYRASDGKGESNAAIVTIKVKRAPAVVWANPATIGFGAPLGAAQLNATAAVDGTFTYTPAAGTVLDAGDGQELSVMFTPSDTANYSAVTQSVVINVTKAPTTAAVTLSKSPQQYTDLETFRATISSPVAGPPIAESVTFMVGTLVMGTAPLTWSGAGYEGVLANVPLLEPDPATGQLQPTPLGRTVRAVFNNVNANYTVTSPSRTLMISKEDARAAVSGTQMVYAAADGSAVVRLTALVRDISSTSEAGADVNGGDIRVAPVLFINRDTGMAISPYITMTLPDPDTKSVGLASFDWSINIGATTAQTFRIGVLIDKYFVRYNSVDDLLVTVAKPLTTRFISGGGHLVLTSSSGLKPGDGSSRNDFGFAVSYKGSGSSPAGHFHTMFRSGGGVYQIKGTIGSLVVFGNTAKLSGAAIIYNVTNGLSIVDSGARFEVSATDAGDSGIGDRIAMTVRNGNGMVWFSNNWSGNASIEQTLAAGNITIR